MGRRTQTRIQIETSKVGNCYQFYYGLVVIGFNGLAVRVLLNLGKIM